MFDFFYFMTWALGIIALVGLFFFWFFYLRHAERGSKLLLAALNHIQTRGPASQDRYEPIHYLVRLYLSSKSNPSEIDDVAKTLLKELLPDSPHWSGDNQYPVIGSRDAYYTHADAWSHGSEMGDRNQETLSWLIAKIEEDYG